MKVVNLRKQHYTLYIGRESAFGNPFRIGRDGTREEVIIKYEKRARRDFVIFRLIANIPKEAILGCYCKPKACHGDIIIKIWKEIHNV